MDRIGQDQVASKTPIALDYFARSLDQVAVILGMIASAFTIAAAVASLLHGG